MSPVAAWGLTAAIVWLSLTPESSVADAGLPGPSEHVLAYAAAGAAFALAYPRRFLVCLAWLTTLCLLLEAAQGLVPGREAELFDAVGSAAGALLGAALALGMLNARQWLEKVADRPARKG